MCLGSPEPRLTFLFHVKNNKNKKTREYIMNVIEFKKEYLDIVKLLNSPAVVGM